MLIGTPRACSLVAFLWQAMASGQQQQHQQPSAAALASAAAAVGVSTVSTNDAVAGLVWTLMADLRGRWGWRHAAAHNDCCGWRLGACLPPTRHALLGAVEGRPGSAVVFDSPVVPTYVYLPT